MTLDNTFELSKLDCDIYTIPDLTNSKKRRQTIGAVPERDTSLLPDALIVNNELLCEYKMDPTDQSTFKESEIEKQLND